VGGSSRAPWCIFNVVAGTLGMAEADYYSTQTVLPHLITQNARARGHAWPAMTRTLPSPIRTASTATGHGRTSPEDALQENINRRSDANGCHSSRNMEQFAGTWTTCYALPASRSSASPLIIGGVTLRFGFEVSPRPLTRRWLIPPAGRTHIERR
jgi:hypothetical protein